MTLHLKCSGRAKRSVNRLIAATRAEAFIGALIDLDEKHHTIEEFEQSQSSLELLIARLEQRVSQNV